MDRQQRYDDMGYPSPYAQYNTDSAYTYDQELSSRPSYNYNQGYTQGRNEPWSPQDSYHTSLREPTSMSYHSNTMHNPSYSQNHTHADPDTGYDQLPVADLPLYELPPQYVPRADVSHSALSVSKSKGSGFNEIILFQCGSLLIRRSLIFSCY